MNIDQLYNNKTLLEKEIARFKKEKAIRQSAIASTLDKAHLDKAKHNLRFVAKNITDEEFNDWTIVGLYYAVYHASLALLANKGYISKDHNATLLLLIKEYGISKEEAELIEQLHLTKEDAEFYATLKEQRRSASYATGTLFRTERVRKLREESILFINKAEEMLKK
ncbi:MAG: DNA-binding protein [archaeon]